MQRFTGDEAASRSLHMMVGFHPFAGLERPREGLKVRSQRPAALWGWSGEKFTDLEIVQTQRRVPQFSQRISDPLLCSPFLPQ